MGETFGIIVIFIIGIMVGIVGGMYIEQKYTENHLSEFGYVKVDK
jgi:uncharacterized protein YneF (UPF0154 family)